MWQFTVRKFKVVARRDSKLLRNSCATLVWFPHVKEIQSTSVLQVTFLSHLQALQIPHDAHQIIQCETSILSLWPAPFQQHGKRTMGGARPWIRYHQSDTVTRTEKSVHALKEASKREKTIKDEFMPTISSRRYYSLSKAVKRWSYIRLDGDIDGGSVAKMYP